MLKAKIEILIRGYVQENYRRHPGAFSDPLIKSIATAKALAAGYWQYRSDNEIRRDMCAKVTKAHYEEWVTKEILETKRPDFYN